MSNKKQETSKVCPDRVSMLQLRTNKLNKHQNKIHQSDSFEITTTHYVRCNMHHYAHAIPPTFMHMPIICNNNINVIIMCE